ncbi:putative exported protein precursor [Halalkalibacter wakoensis JCM 9140]|uniref:Putative exported protein n=2 Tax=Halalkalibacter wakoensis TaxID=127891 RepID=W4Q653_9BACI|nr:putative exported protein precursor [Halalkalibacter wakoensis JCM 9140]
MKSKIYVIVGLVVVALAAAFFALSDVSDTVIEPVTEDIKELVHDYSVRNITSPSASITSHELIVTNHDQKQVIYDLPKDEFFVSIAPYYDHTHP